MAGESRREHQEGVSEAVLSGRREVPTVQPGEKRGSV